MQYSIISYSQHVVQSSPGLTYFVSWSLCLLTFFDLIIVLLRVNEIVLSQCYHFFCTYCHSAMKGSFFSSLGRVVWYPEIHYLLERQDIGLDLSFSLPIFKVDLCFFLIATSCGSDGFFCSFLVSSQIQSATIIILLMFTFSQLWPPGVPSSSLLCLAQPL